MKYDYSDTLKQEMYEAKRQARLEQLRQWREVLRPIWEIALTLIAVGGLGAMFAYCLLMCFTEPSLNGTY